MKNDVDNYILIYYDHNSMCDNEIVIIFFVIVRIWNLAIYYTIHFKYNFLSLNNDICCKKILWHIVVKITLK